MPRVNFYVHVVCLPSAMFVCVFNSHSKFYSHSLTSDGGRSQCSSSCSCTCCTGTTTTTTGGSGVGGCSNISQEERFVLSVASVVSCTLESFFF